MKRRDTKSEEHIKTRLFKYCTALLLISLAFVVFHFSYTVDDAYIYWRYANNLLNGKGYSFSPVDGPSDGITAPLWLLFIVPVGLVDAAAGLMLAKIVSASFVVISLLLMCRRGSPVGALLVSLSGSLWVYATSGLESGAVVFAVAVMEVWRNKESQRHVVPIALMCLTPWLRPEASLLMFLRCPTSFKKKAIWFLLSVGTIAALRWFHFGHALPLSAMAKPAILGNAGQYILFWFVGGGGGLFLAAAAFGSSHEKRDLFVCAAVHICAVAFAGGDWMPGFRLMLPALVVLGFHIRAPAFEQKVRCVGFWLLTLLCASVFGVENYLLGSQGRNATEESMVARSFMLPLLRGKRVACSDVGWVSAYATSDIIDLAGVTNEVIGALPGKHMEKEIDESWFADKSPDVLLLAHPNQGVEVRPAESRVLRFTKDDFSLEMTTRWAGSFFYDVYVRKEVAEMPSL